MKTEIIGVQNRQTDPASQRRGTNGKQGAEAARLYSKIVERYAMFFDRPSDRLRFLNNTLRKQAERQEQLQQSLRHFRFLERTRFYGWILEGRFYSAILEELTELAQHLPENRQRMLERIEVPLSARAFFFFHQARHAFYAAGVIFAALFLFTLYSVVSWSAKGVNTYLSQRYNRGKQIIVKTEGQGSASALAATTAKYLPDYKADKVWQVGHDGESETYSNGCRILTRYETENYQRSYYTIPRNQESEGEEVRHDIVGLVYHTSESDIVPFIPKNNDAIQKRSQGLIEFIRRNKSYNYVIDRYGGIYRVVRDDHTAFHAGNSIWADEKYNYVVLNESFIGVCFESTVEAGSLEETLTEAQIIAGRALTNVLRSKYNIADVNCTTHGLVSVNPDKMLIAFHHDWVRNFPFEAMGLSDKYKVPPPNMLDYGFTYDEEILAKLGNNLWEGAISAEEEFRKRADKARVNPELLRRRLRDRYIAQREKARKLRPAQSGAGTLQLAAQSPAESSSAESGNN
ncbi:MAG: peptidoglycan recognition family protein [Blastocatellia bacterium]|nr:peptidoglycan recognition family protein [Blastocatellia bacterium]